METSCSPSFVKSHVSASCLLKYPDCCFAQTLLPLLLNVKNFWDVSSAVLSSVVPLALALLNALQTAVSLQGLTVEAMISLP